MQGFVNRRERFHVGVVKAIFFVFCKHINVSAAPLYGLNILIADIGFLAHEAEGEGVFSKDKGVSPNIENPHPNSPHDEENRRHD